MLILHDLLKKLKDEFTKSRKADELGIWFVYTLLAIIIPFTSSKTSNILRCLNSLFRMHVSPFNNLMGEYEFLFSPPNADLDIQIRLVRDGAEVFTARLTGAPMPLTAARSQPFEDNIAPSPHSPSHRPANFHGGGPAVFFQKNGLSPETRTHESHDH